MIIEFYGLPGAGKTTYAQELSRMLNISVIRLSLPKRVFFWLMAFFSAPVETFFGVTFLFRHSKDHRYSYFMNGCLDRYARFAYAKKYGGILDEGPLQNILSFPSRILFQKEIDALVANFPHPDVIIHISADNSVRKNRQETRGRVVRDDVWEAYASENERMAILALPPKVVVLEFPAMSLVDIAEKIRSL